MQLLFTHSRLLYLDEISESQIILKPAITDDQIPATTGISKPEHAQAFSAVRTEHMGFMGSLFSPCLMRHHGHLASYFRSLSLHHAGGCGLCSCPQFLGNTCSRLHSPIVLEFCLLWCSQWDLPVGGEEASQGTWGASCSSVSPEVEPSDLRPNKNLFRWSWFFSSKTKINEGLNSSFLYSRVSYTI